MSRRRPGLVLASIATAVVVAGAGCSPDGTETEAAVATSAPPADYGRVGEFALRDQAGRPFERGALAGKVWVAAFVFTRCSGPCPRITAELVALERELFDAKASAGAAATPERLRLVAFSVDPEHDDAAVLGRYGERFGLSPDRSHLLTGEREAIYRLARESFHLGIEKATDPDVDPGQAVTHSTRLALVDADGRIRSYHDVNDPEALAELRRHVRALLAGDEG